MWAPNNRKELSKLNDLSLPKRGRRDEAVAQGVLGNRPRFEKLKEVVRPAGLGADAGELQAAERLALDDGAGDAAVDVEVAHAEFLPRFFDMRRRAGKDTAGQ